MSGTQHQNTLDIFNIMFEHHIVASYVGPVDGDILTLLAENIEQTLWRSETQRKRFFKIFIELAQNVALYSEERAFVKDKKYGAGTLIISDFGEYFSFTAGNIVTKKTKEILAEKGEKINSCNRVQLREMKRKLRKTGNNKGGGNIGLVQVALLAKNPFDIEFFPIDDSKYFYLVSVKINKE